MHNIVSDRELIQRLVVLNFKGSLLDEGLERIFQFKNSMNNHWRSLGQIFSIETHLRAFAMAPKDSLSILFLE